MTSFPDLFAALAAKFRPDEERSITKGNRPIKFITAASVMNRLDNVLGPENWHATYTPGERSVACELTITCPDGRAISRVGVGAFAGMDDEGDDDKSAYSDGIKVAARGFGVGRYLCGVGGPTYFPPGDLAEGPEPAPPPPPAPRAAPPANGNGHATNGRAADDGHRNGEPRTGRALFSWCRQREEIHGVGLIKYMASWAKLQDFPGRMVDFDVAQVRAAYAEAARKIEQVAGSSQS